MLKSWIDSGREKFIEVMVVMVDIVVVVEDISTVLVFGVEIFR